MQHLRLLCVPNNLQLHVLVIVTQIISCLVFQCLTLILKARKALRARKIWKILWSACRERCLNLAYIVLLLIMYRAPLLQRFELKWGRANALIKFATLKTILRSPLLPKRFVYLRLFQVLPMLVSKFLMQYVKMFV